jgi:hypothetical protein
MLHTPRHLTNQYLNDCFDSPFALLSQPIKLGRESAKYAAHLE